MVSSLCRDEVELDIRRHNNSRQWMRRSPSRRILAGQASSRAGSFRGDPAPMAFGMKPGHSPNAAAPHSVQRS
jgi:hypothetical protein